MLFVIRELFHVAPLLSLYDNQLSEESNAPSVLSSAHTCSNEEVMLLTSIKAFLSHGVGVSSSMTKFHTGEN